MGAARRGLMRRELVAPPLRNYKKYGFKRDGEDEG